MTHERRFPGHADSSGSSEQMSKSHPDARSTKSKQIITESSLATRAYLFLKFCNNKNVASPLRCFAVKFYSENKTVSQKEERLWNQTDQCSNTDVSTCWLGKLLNIYKTQLSHLKKRRKLPAFGKRCFGSEVLMLYRQGLGHDCEQ